MRLREMENVSRLVMIDTREMQDMINTSGENRSFKNNH